MFALRAQMPRGWANDSVIAATARSYSPKTFKRPEVRCENSAARMAEKNAKLFKRLRVGLAA